MKAVILAGGKGTRLGRQHAALPKPMVRIGDLPLLEHQIRLLQKYGVHDIIIITGHLGEAIERYCGDGSRFGLTISYYREATPLGTTGGIREIEDRLAEDFIVIYGDVMADMNLSRFIAFHFEKKSDCTLVLHPNDHPFDSDLVEIDQQLRITAFHAKPHPQGTFRKNLVNAGLYILSPRVVSRIPKGVKADFGSDIFPEIVCRLRVFGYCTPEYLKDVGTPERLEEVSRDYLSGKIARLNIDNSRKAVFLDRDGVINREVGLLSNRDDFELLDGAARAIKKINESEYLAVVITNQSVVARNLCTIGELEEIHAKMETLLGRHGAKLDAIYYCPHHPDRGYPEENPDYKIDCTCRKPKTGLIDRAVQELHIDLNGSFFIGDSPSDILCGRAAGLTTIGLRNGLGCKSSDVQPDYFFENLYEAACFIFEEPCRDFFQRVRALLLQSCKKPFVIAIGGNSRSGKTVLARFLADELKKCSEKVLCISLDNWLKPQDMRTPGDDVCERFQLHSIQEDLQRLLRGDEICRKKYDQFSRRLTDTIVRYRLRDASVVIIDGVVALSSGRMRSMADVKIFCAIDDSLLAKRITNFYRWKGLAAQDIAALLAKRKSTEYDIIAHDGLCADMIVTAREYAP